MPGLPLSSHFPGTRQSCILSISRCCHDVARKQPWAVASTYAKSTHMSMLRVHVCQKQLFSPTYSGRRLSQGLVRWLPCRTPALHTKYDAAQGSVNQRDMSMNPHIFTFSFRLMNAGSRDLESSTLVLHSPATITLILPFY